MPREIVTVTIQRLAAQAKSGAGYAPASGAAWTVISGGPWRARVYRTEQASLNTDQGGPGTVVLDSQVIVSLHTADNSGRTPEEVLPGDTVIPAAGPYSGRSLLVQRVRRYYRGIQIDVEDSGGHGSK